MAAKIKVIHINPNGRTIVAGEIGNNLTSFQRHVGATSGYVEDAPLLAVVIDKGWIITQDHYLFFDDDGRRKDNMYFTIGGIEIAGKAFITAVNGDGDNVDVELTVEQVAEIVRWGGQWAARFDLRHEVR